MSTVFTELKEAAHLYFSRSLVRLLHEYPIMQVYILHISLTPRMISALKNKEVANKIELHVLTVY